jgi:hypothetical protein
MCHAHGSPVRGGLAQPLISTEAAIMAAGLNPPFVPPARRRPQALSQARVPAPWAGGRRGRLGRCGEGQGLAGRAAGGAAVVLANWPGRDVPESLAGDQHSAGPPWRFVIMGPRSHAQAWPTLLATSRRLDATSCRLYATRRRVDAGGACPQYRLRHCDPAGVRPAARGQPSMPLVEKELGPYQPPQVK